MKLKFPVYTNTKGVGISQPIWWVPQYESFHALEDVYLHLREISHNIGIFSGRFPLPIAKIFPPCKIFQSYSHSKELLQQGFEPVSPWMGIIHSNPYTIPGHRT
jgi:hypothetical protein